MALRRGWERNKRGNDEGGRGNRLEVRRGLGGCVKEEESKEGRQSLFSREKEAWTGPGLGCSTEADCV